MRILYIKQQSTIFVGLISKLYCFYSANYTLSDYVFVPNTTINNYYILGTDFI